MKRKNYESISEMFTQAETYLKNGMEHEEIKKKLSQKGYKQNMFLEGEALLTECKLLHHQKKTMYGEKSELSSLYQTQVEEARSIFLDHVAIVKHVYRKDPIRLSKFNATKFSKKVSE